MEATYHIFYTDDDRDDQDMFRQVLQDLKDDVVLHIHDNGDELLAGLKNPPPRPRVVFLDLNMPNKDGFEVLKEIREDKEIKDTSIVIFSTSDDPKAIQRTWDLDANLFVTKPASYIDFKKTILDLVPMDWLNFKVDRAHFVYKMKK